MQHPLRPFPKPETVDRGGAFRSVLTFRVLSYSPKFGSVGISEALHASIVTRTETRLALSVAVAVAIIGGAWSVADHFAFGTNAFDSGVIDHALWRVTHGLDDVSSLNGLSLFADHPSPIFLLLAPVYLVAPLWGLPVYFALRAVSTGMWFGLPG